FQAEDGIRDGHVTGVQTCALPILANTICGRLTFLSINFLSTPKPSRPGICTSRKTRSGACSLIKLTASTPFLPCATTCTSSSDRSEERRVGKECRSMWSQQYEQET